MKLPRGQDAVVPEIKITGYLLAENHPVGKAKARFFRSLGCRERNIAQLKDSFVSVAATGEVTEVISSPYGTKVVVDGGFTAPKGVPVLVRTVWIVEEGEDEPRFITAYPREEADEGATND